MLSFVHNSHFVEQNSFQDKNFRHTVTRTKPTQILVPRPTSCCAGGAGATAAGAGAGAGACGAWQGPPRARFWCN